MDLTKAILDAVTKREPDEHRSYIGASSIGSPCERSIWYDFKGYDHSSIPPETLISFEIGKRLEDMILKLIADTGISIQGGGKLLKDKDVPIFQGHCDGILVLDSMLPPIVLEIKTAKHSSFNIFKTKGLQIWQPTYYAQIQAYMGMTEFEQAVIVVLDKDTSKIHHEWVEYDDIYYHELKGRASRISEAIEAPPKINNSPLYFVCSMCRFRKVCHE